MSAGHTRVLQKMNGKTLIPTLVNNPLLPFQARTAPVPVKVVHVFYAQPPQPTPTRTYVLGWEPLWSARSQRCQ